MYKFKWLSDFSVQVILFTAVFAFAFSFILREIDDIKAGCLYEQTEKKTNSSENSEKMYKEENVRELQQGIASGIIRLHVIANSDSVEDQTLKYQVRDGILSSLQNELSDVEEKADAEKLLMKEQESILAAAKKVIYSKGYDYDVKLSLEDRYFPTKTYGDLVFPEGTYRALCVEIGQAEGRNWWCVLFPSLCFVDETCAVVPDESKEKLKKNMTGEEYQSLEKNDENVEVHFALYDWIMRNKP